MAVKAKVAKARKAARRNSGEPMKLRIVLIVA
jgi:hypothetical protein